MTDRAIPAAQARLQAPPAWRAFATLYHKERRQGTGTLLLLAAGVLLTFGVLVWQLDPVVSIENDDVPRLTFVFLLALIPVALAVLGGFEQLRSEYARNTQSLLQSLPVRGVTILLAKLAWLWTQAAILTLVVLACLLALAAYDFPREFAQLFAGAGLHDWGRFLLELSLALLAGLLLIAPFSVLPMLATACGRLVRRYETLLTFLAYALLLAAHIYLVRALALLGLAWPGLPLPVVDVIEVSGEFLLYSALVALGALGLTGWLFERQDK